MKAVSWNGKALDELRSFPVDVRREVGAALREAQNGGLSPMAKPFIRHKNHQVYEIVADADESNRTFRVMCLVDLPDAIWVVHAFVKKSTPGIATPQREIDLVKKRVDLAIAESEARLQQHE